MIPPARNASTSMNVARPVRAATQPELQIFVDFIGESTRSLVR